jgi:serine/threonine protein kinase
MNASNDIILTKEKLGDGISSNVFSCLIKDEKYAIKLYKQNVSHLAKLHEIEMMKSLNHENILRLI